MFDKRLLWTVLSVLTVVAASAGASGLIHKENAMDSGERVSHVEIADSSAEAADPREQYPYLLKEYQGQVAVFRVGQEEPLEVFGTLTKHLPDFDQGQLRQGIPVASYEELVNLIEDFIS